MSDRYSSIITNCHYRSTVCICTRWLLRGMAGFQEKRRCRSSAAGPIGAVIWPHEFIQDSCEIMQPVQVSLGQLLENPVSIPGQPDAYDPAIRTVRRPLHHAGGLGTVDKFHRAVRPEQEVAGEVANGGRLVSRMSLDRDQQLMLDVSQASSLRLVFAPPLEFAQGDTEIKQSLEILLA